MTKKELIAELQDARDEWAVGCDHYDALHTAVSMAEKLDDPPMLQKGPNGMLYPCPMPAQQEPSALEVALRLIEAGKCPAVPTQARAAAFALIDAVRAEEARRAGK